MSLVSGIPLFFNVGIDIASLLVVSIIAYYSIKLLLIMRMGALEKSWRFVSIGSFLLACGLVFFATTAFFSITPAQTGLFAFGGISMTSGGIFLMLGLRVQYKVFHLQLSYAKRDERIGDLV